MLNGWGFLKLDLMVQRGIIGGEMVCVAVFLILLLWDFEDT